MSGASRRSCATGPRAAAARSSNVNRILKNIAEASGLAGRSEEAYRAGDRHAERLRTGAESAHRELLLEICGLSEAEADFVEPAFTDLETRLLRLPAAAALRHPDRPV